YLSFCDLVSRRCNVGRWLICFRFLFFQAEDGIRYRNVTGVQTCALPISSRTAGSTGRIGAGGPCPLIDRPVGARGEGEPVEGLQIGRASCRERGWNSAVESVPRKSGGDRGAKELKTTGKGSALGPAGRCG